MIKEQIEYNIKYCQDVIYNKKQPQDVIINDNFMIVIYNDHILQISKYNRIPLINGISNFFTSKQRKKYIAFKLSSI